MRTAPCPYGRTGRIFETFTLRFQTHNTARAPKGLSFRGRTRETAHVFLRHAQRFVFPGSGAIPPLCPPPRRAAASTRTRAGGSPGSLHGRTSSHHQRRRDRTLARDGMAFAAVGSKPPQAVATGAAAGDDAAASTFLSGADYCAAGTGIPFAAAAAAGTGVAGETYMRCSPKAT